MGVSHGRPGIAVAQQLLHLVERMPGIHEKTGEGVPQIVDTHVGKSQAAPQLVPEHIDVGERFARGMAGEQPRTARLVLDGTDDRYGLIGQRDMARLAGLGQRHDEQAEIQADMFPTSLDDFTLACAGQQKQADGRGLGPRRPFQLPHEPPGFVGGEIALAQRVDFKGKHARTGRLPDGQQAVRARQGADTFEYGKGAVAGGRGQSLDRQIPQPFFHFMRLNVGKPPIPEGRGKMLPRNARVHLPAPLAELDMRQIDIRNKGIKVDCIALRKPAVPAGQRVCGGI